MSQEEIKVHHKNVIAFFKHVTVEKRTRKRRPKVVRMPKELHDDPDNGLPLMVRAKKILGKRMEERWGGYYLDGRPASSEKIAEAANLFLGKS